MTKPLKTASKTAIIKHIDKDSKEFKKQLKEDKELRSALSKMGKNVK